MAFNTGLLKLNITQDDSGYDFTVVQGESEVIYSGGLDADIVWSIERCADVVLKSGSESVPVPSAVLQTVFSLTQKKKEKKKGKVAIVESKLRDLKRTSPNNFNQIMTTFLGANGLLFLNVSTESTAVLPLNTDLLEAPQLFAAPTGQNAAAGLSP
jgi:hypothetical protein